MSDKNSEASTPCVLNTFDGNVTVEWDPDATVTPLGQLPFFIEFLKVGGRFSEWVDDCPLHYTAHNAPKKIDLLGSLFLAVLSGHSRYAHLSALRNDRVNSTLLGMNKIVSEDSARRGLKRINEIDGVSWLQSHLEKSVSPLLDHAWVLDCDVTIKPLFGHQEGAVKGYNPKRPGRPSHSYHSYLIANLRLVLEVEVQPGNQTASSHSLPGLIALLNRLPQAKRPQFVRGDSDWGTEGVMTELEAMKMDYLFKIKRSAAIKTLINQQHHTRQWKIIRDNWEGKETEVQLKSWPYPRRVVLFRRRIQSDNIVLALPTEEQQQQTLGFIDGPEDMQAYQYSVLVTSLDSDIVSLFYHYRDRADCENIFDEIKNHWGWGGYTTKDIASCQLMSRMTALIYNWWSLFVRVANPDNHHMEAISSRPSLLSSVGQLIQSGRKKTLRITSHHSRASFWQKALTKVHEIIKHVKLLAPQQNTYRCWEMLLSNIIDKFCVKPPDKTLCIIPP